MDFSKLSNAEYCLLLYVIHEYKPGSFNTSFTTCSMFETQDERMLGACFEEDCDWMENLLHLTISIIQRTGLAYDSKEASRLRRFTIDALDDLLLCHTREM